MMEIKVSEGRNIKARDPVAEKEGVFACIANEDLTRIERERTEHREAEEISDEKVWSISEIAKRLAVWLHLTK